jgi:hypothetical protein
VLERAKTVLEITEISMVKSMLLQNRGPQAAWGKPKKK